MSQEITKFINEQYIQLKYYALKFTRNEADAEDLIQDTLMRAWLYQNKYTSETKLRAWVHIIMKNTFINSIRKKSKRSICYLDPQTQAYTQTSSVDGGIEMEISTKLIEEIIQQMQPKYQKPFLMYFHGYKYQEIAQELHLPLGTVKTYIFRARIMLQKQLKSQSRIIL